MPRRTESISETILQQKVERLEKNPLVRKKHKLLKTVEDNLKQLCSQGEEARVGVGPDLASCVI